MTNEELAAITERDRRWHMYTPWLDEEIAEQIALDRRALLIEVSRLREAAAALSAGCQHVPLEVEVWCDNLGGIRLFPRHKFGGCPGPHRRLYVEAEQTEQTKQEG